MTFGSDVEVRAKLRFRQELVTVRVNLQEINTDLCDAPRSDLTYVRVCLYVCNISDVLMLVISFYKF